PSRDGAASFARETKLLGKVGGDQLRQGRDGFLFITAVCDQVDRSALNNAQRQNAQQAFCVNAALVLLDPDAALEFVGFLNKEGRRSGVQADLVIDRDLLHVHRNSTPSNHIFSDSYTLANLP